uniref:Uncharacterized protein n=1 Tax=Anopheles epiroticus TaxID=199890 RepID=A0A182PWK5_9DIPT
HVDPEIDKFTIDVSIDGLPLFKSSRKQLWPIQIRVLELIKTPPFIVGTFGGSMKPGNLEEFLNPFVEEINDLQQRGILFEKKLVPFFLRAVIADSPMRATLKATMNFNARHGCLKCTCVGTSISTGPNSKKIILDSVDADPRTDAGFRERIDACHHKEWRSPLEDIHNFDMVENVPVSERMHLVDEGVTQKILMG